MPPSITANHSPQDPSSSPPSKEEDEKSSSSRLVESFVANLEAQNQRQDLERQLQNFVLQHVSHHRPIALVTSGGTAADLEVHSVRCLDNFSTGTRGAASIEALLRKGYAVIHLWRTGSASPFGRLLAEAVGIGGNQGISTAAMGKLFVGAGDSLQDEEDRMVQSVLEASNNNNGVGNNNEDPWLTDPAAEGNNTTTNNNNNSHQSSTSSMPSSSSTNTKRNSNSHFNNRQSGNHHNPPVALHRRMEYSSRLQMALRERQSALQEGRLLTVPFRSIEEYLAKLYLCSTALRECQTLALIYLAAAVSDFYVPFEQRSEHKIQSTSSSTISAGGHGLTLTLEPVPKVMGLLRSSWAPDAFVCSFKLETDPTLLRQKAERAVQKYGCHMVVGNLLETRYTQVQVLAPPDFGVAAAPAMVSNWPMQSIHKPNKGGDPDSLENQLVDVVVQVHFDYISTSGNGTLDKAGTEAVLRAHQELEESKRRVQRELFWEKVRTTGLEWAGVAAGALLSYVISTALRRRMGA